MFVGHWQNVVIVLCRIADDKKTGRFTVSLYSPVGVFTLKLTVYYFKVNARSTEGNGSIRSREFFSPSMNEHLITQLWQITELSLIMKKQLGTCKCHFKLQRWWRNWHIQVCKPCFHTCTTWKHLKLFLKLKSFVIFFPLNICQTKIWLHNNLLSYMIARHSVVGVCMALMCESTPFLFLGRKWIVYKEVFLTK